jgi:actin-related protein
VNLEFFKHQICIHQHLNWKRNFRTEHQLKLQFSLDSFNILKILQKIGDTFLIQNSILTPTSKRLLLTENPMYNYLNREKMVEVFFEEFEVESLYFSPNILLSLYSSGRTTGLAFDSGHTFTHSCSIFSGEIVENSLSYSSLGGTNIDDFLNVKLFKKSLGDEFWSSAKEVDIPFLKKSCFVCVDQQKLDEKIVTLPDGNSIMLYPDVQQNGCEVFFDNQELTFQQMILNSISSNDESLIHDQLKNIAIFGGNSMLNNFVERLKHEMNQLFTHHSKISSIGSAKISSSQERMLSSWIGGSILGSLSVAPTFFVNKNEYLEHGDCRKLGEALIIPENYKINFPSKILKFRETLMKMVKSKSFTNTNFQF